MDELAAERKRCLDIVESMAAKWETSADTLIATGTYRTMFGRLRPTKYAERSASTLRAAASGLRTCAYLIREGMVRKSA